MNDKKIEHSNDDESIIILAAGSSSRLGQSKQMVEIDGVPLLLKSTLAALDANYSHVMVVLGSNADMHKKTIAHLRVEIITHDDWEKGMGSSLKTGLTHVLKSRPGTKAVVVMVCDQPLLTSVHLTSLRDVYKKTSAKIVASRYKNITGVPALFDRILFPELLEITDTQGAKVIIERSGSSVNAIDWAEGQLDIDTPEDLKLINSQRG
jgi:molybdenum cofactor cytidylyltransferase